MRTACLSTIIALAFGVAVAGCSDDEGVDVLSYDEFKARAYQEPQTGMYVINGDELVTTEEQMRDAYESFLDSVVRANSDGYATTEQGLLVNRIGGKDDKWSSTGALNLTYCISKASFGSRYTEVVNAMKSAAGAWEGAGRIDFKHSLHLDAICTNNIPAVVFNVRQVTNGAYLARAFFPNTFRSGRELLIDSTAFGASPYTLTGILRHELGHVLGFRHEHTRPEAGTLCFEDNNWRILTAYDSVSVMRYPHCTSNVGGDLVLSARDKAGANLLYK